jgi:hypothetical protein
MSDQKTHSTIDLVLMHGLHDISQPVALDQFSSDHLLVLSDVYFGSLSLNPQTKVPSYKNANGPSFMSYFVASSEITCSRASNIS